MKENEGGIIELLLGLFLAPFRIFSSAADAFASLFGRTRK